MNGVRWRPDRSERGIWRSRATQTRGRGVARAALPSIPGPLGPAQDELCDPKLCPDAPDDGDRCDQCPLDKLDGAQSSGAGLLIRRALDLRAALKLGIHLGLDDIRADEFCAMLILEDERDRPERESVPGGG